MQSHMAVPAAPAAGNSRRAALAWMLCALVLALVAGAAGGVALRGGGLLDQIYLVAITSCALVGGIVAARRQTSPIGWLLLAGALCYSLYAALTQYVLYNLSAADGDRSSAAALAWLPGVVIIPGIVSLLALLPLVFPDGRLPSPRWRPAAWFAVIFAALATGYAALRPGELAQAPGVTNPIGWDALRPLTEPVDRVMLWMWVALVLLAAASLVARYRRSVGEERQQLKWLTFAIAAWAGIIPLTFPAERWSPALFVALDHLLALAFAGIPIAVGIAVLRYRLYDIDLLINRTLVYASLTASVAVIYALSVAGAGVLFQGQGRTNVALLATVLVAVLFAPLRDRLQRGVNRLLYGQRDEPYLVLARLGARLESTLAPDSVLPAIVQTVAETLKLPYVAVALLGNCSDPADPDAAGSAAPVMAAYGATPAPGAALLTLPLSYQGDPVGRLVLAPRSREEEWAADDLRLLHDLARQAGAAVHAVQLTAALQARMEELRRSRERLVMAQEEERRRIQRDLHDGLGPVLASMRMRLEAVLDRAQAAEPEIVADLERLDQLVGQATGDIRRLVHDLRPPALDQLGLIPALRQHAERWSRETGVTVRFDAATGVALSAAAEVAIYRIVHEALVNVHKHAGAREVNIRIEPLGKALLLHIGDDGRGGAVEGRGTGLGSLRERAELLGGTLTLRSQPGLGTTLEVYLPIAEVVG